MRHTDTSPRPGIRAGQATCDPGHPRDAAQWFARMHSGEATEEDRRGFEAWLTADAQHGRQYRNLAYLWEAARVVPEARLRALAEDVAAAAPRTVRPWRRLGVGLVCACLLAGVVSLPDTSRPLVSPLERLELATHKGERRQTTLPDGSILTLNADTRVIVRFDGEQRLVELRRGEAFFDVRHETSRPFVVDAGMGQVTVTGTRFNVRRDVETLQVSVESGSVLVQSGRWWHRSEHRLAAGQQTVAHAGKALDPVAPVHVGQVAAWRRGKVIFSNTPLADVVSDMNRYLRKPVMLDAPRLAQHRVSGVFSIEDPQAMIDALPAIAPVRVLRPEDGSVRIIAR